MIAPGSKVCWWLAAAVGALLLAAFPLLAQLVVPGAPNPAPQNQPPTSASDAPSFTGELPGSTLWKDTGLDVEPGDTVRIIANGELRYSDAKEPCGPDGYPRGWKDLIRLLPSNEAGRGALIARIGNNQADRPFLAGSSNRFQAPLAGRLYVGINQMWPDTGNGSYHVTVIIRQRASGDSPPPQTNAASFSALFCSVLEREHPDAGRWGECSEYIESPSSDRVSLPAIPRTYRLAIVSGVLTACGGNSTAYLQGRAHLRTVHGITVDLIPAPNGSSTANGRTIAEFLKKNYAKDGRKFILLGYSKGAPDILEGVANDPEAAQAVAALITVAGAIGGSPIADLMPIQAQRWIQAISLGQCKGDLYAAFRSLRRDVRRKFLALHPDPGFPVYSIAAASSKARTSKILLEGWELLSVYGQPEDSQLLESDTRYPGGHNLGVVHADHMAVAIPMENSSDPTVRQLVNHNHFPRTALLESLLRFVVQDLDRAHPTRASQTP